METVPYIVFESEMARHERINKRLMIALVITIALLFISNVIWLWTFGQFDFETETVTLDAASGNANYIGDGSEGVILNGEGGSEETQNDSEGW